MGFIKFFLYIFCNFCSILYILTSYFTIDLTNIFVEFFYFIRINIYYFFNFIFTQLETNTITPTINILIFLKNYVFFFSQIFPSIINSLFTLISVNIFFLCFIYYTFTIIIIYLIVNFCTLSFNIFNKLINYANPVTINLLYILFK